MIYTLSIQHEQNGAPVGRRCTIEVPEDATPAERQQAVAVAARTIHANFADMLGVERPRVMLRDQR